MDKQQLAEELYKLIKNKEKYSKHLTKKMEAIPDEDWPNYEAGQLRIEYSVLAEEIDDIEQIINSDFSDEEINNIASSTTSTSLYFLLKKYKGEEVKETKVDYVNNLFCTMTQFLKENPLCDVEEIRSIYNQMILLNLKCELLSAIKRYGANNIDLSAEIDTDVLYGFYHSENNSFAVTKDYIIDINKFKKDIMNMCAELNIAYCEE